jgi:hypothetical protein
VCASTHGPRFRAGRVNGFQAWGESPHELPSRLKRIQTTVSAVHHWASHASISASGFGRRSRCSIRRLRDLGPYRHWRCRPPARDDDAIVRCRSRCGQGDVCRWPVAITSWRRFARASGRSLRFFRCSGLDGHRRCLHSTSFRAARGSNCRRDLDRASWVRPTLRSQVEGSRLVAECCSLTACSCFGADTSARPRTETNLAPSV